MYGKDIMEITRNDQRQVGSLRIWKFYDGRVALVRWDGQNWIEAENSGDLALQNAMSAAVDGLPHGFYVPTPAIGRNARIFPAA